MTRPAVATPADLTITPRNIAFGRGESNPRWWLNGDPVATTFYNALSVTFPQGEGFFIEAVRRFKDDVPAPLREQIASFVKQEALHTREHVAFNRQVTDHGYDISRMEGGTKERLDISRSKHPVVQLAVTVALEHFTAIIAHALLAAPHHLDGAPAEVRRLWLWHALEEVEHKAVAYDTFLHVTRNISGFKRWSIRTRVMMLVTWNFVKYRKVDMADFFEQDGIRNAGTWLRTLKFLFLTPGLVPRILLPYLSFYRPGFHPWDHDDRDLMRRAEADLAALAPAGEPATA